MGKKKAARSKTNSSQKKAVAPNVPAPPPVNPPYNGEPLPWRGLLLEVNLPSARSDRWRGLLQPSG